MTCTTDRQLPSDLFLDFADQAMQFGRDLLASMNTSTSLMPNAFVDQANAFFARVGRDCCAMPDPCWMPQQLGTVTSHVCPGGTASIRIRVTNHANAPQLVAVEVTGPEAGDASVTPTSQTIGAFERATFTVSFKAGDDDCKRTELVVWVRGCRDHVLRWHIAPAKRGVDTCHELDVTDGPDLFHHWYDHFACARPCNDPKG